MWTLMLVLRGMPKNIQDNITVYWRRPSVGDACTPSDAKNSHDNIAVYWRRPSVGNACTSSDAKNSYAIILLSIGVVPRAG